MLQPYQGSNFRLILRETEFTIVSGPHKYPPHLTGEVVQERVTSCGSGLQFLLEQS